MLSETRLAEIRDRAAWTCRERGADIDALLIHVDHLTAENVTLRYAYMAHAEVCDHDEPTVLGQLDNARRCVLDLTAENAPADVDPPVEFKAGDRVSFAYCGDRITCTLVDGHRGLMSDTPDKDGYRPRVMEESGGLAPFITDVRQITDAEADLARVTKERTASDHIDRAAQEMWDAIDDKGIQGRLHFEDCRYLAQALDAAGLLVTPEHDAAVVTEEETDANS